MKTSKKIFAALLAVMMIVMMIPITASAADNNTITITLNPYAGDDGNESGTADGAYTMGIYKVADFNATTGQYTAVISAAGLQDAINAEKTDSKAQSIINILNGLNGQGLGTAVDTLSFNINGADATDTSVVLADGIYYTYLTSKPGTVKSVTNSLFVLDGTQAYTAEINKVSTAAVTVTKTADTTTVGYDKDVNYTLTASTAGSVDEKIDTYKIVDIMDSALALQDDTVKVFGVKAGQDDVAITDFKLEKNATYDTDKKATFAVVLGSTILGGADFYGYDTIKVTFTAKVTDAAVVNTAMPNSDGVEFGNGSNLTYKTGHTVNVKTLGLKVVKVDGNNDTKYLADAVFGLYEDEACATAVKVNGTAVTATTDATSNGVKFMAGDVEYKIGDTAKTYYVKELTAPTGYNLNSTVFSVTASATATDGYTFVNGEAGVPNYAVTVPQTGGMGTMIFTIVGLSLIACAGVLFVVVRRKKASK